MNENSTRTILLVEDEALIAMAEAQMLKKHGYDVVTAYNGEKAVEAADAHPEISLILMDIDLGKGGIDGPEAAERILATRDLPIVFLSSHTEPEVVEKTEKITSYGYVVKNSGATVLDTSIKMAFRLFAAKNEAKRHEANLRTSEATVRRKLKAITEPDGDLSTLELADIIDVEALQSMMEDFYSISGIGGAVLDTSGRILVGVAWQEICSKFHRIHPDTLENCLESDCSLTSGVPVGTCKAYHCKNNMWDIVTPIVVDGKHAGNVFIGQFFFEDEVPDYELFREQARRHGFDETEYLAALDHVPRFSRETVERAMAFYSRLADMISSLSYTTIKLSRKMVQHQKAEKQLKESEESLRITLNSIGDAVISTDTEGAIVRMNPVAESLCGWNTGRAKGKALEEVFHIVHADTGDKVENPVARVLETGSIIGLANHTMLISKDGTEYQIADSAAPIRDDTGHISGVVLVFRDVSEEYAISQALAASERDMARAQAMAQLGSWRFDLDTGIVTGSDQAHRIYGVDQGDLTIEYVQSLPLAEYRPRLDAALKALVEDGTPYNVEFKIRRPSDNTVRSIHSVAEYDAEHRRIVGTIHDITERKQMEEQTWELRERLQKIIDNSPLVINELDANGHYVMVNETTCTLLKTTKERLTGQHLTDVLPPETASIFQARIDHMAATREQMIFDDTLLIDGQERIFRTVLFPIYRHGDSRPSMVGMAYEITKEMRLLEEKDFLMKELNHRVKNNLAMVASLINLKDSESATDLSDIRHQIEAIGLIHEKLYQSESVAEICLRNYINDLLDTVFSSFTARPVTIEVDIDDFRVSAKIAMPLGLIINEIATNAIKHGFTCEDEARFFVKMDKDRQNGEYEVILSNTGNPFPDEVDLGNPQTLGLRLISALTVQLGGTINLRRAPHPAFTIRFPHTG
jgi:PAS domain S-box-containing protein